MPFAMLRNYHKSPLADERWEGIVFYAPSIFLGPVVNRLKKMSNCKSYLIIRDIFPDWAVDMELMGRGLAFHFFNAIAHYQYSVSDIIGVQTGGNLSYFNTWREKPNRHLEVLKNWLDKPVQLRSSIRVDQTALAGRKVFVYAGNMGVAQGMQILLNLAEKLNYRSDLGFLFVGRGSDLAQLKTTAQLWKLENVLFFDEIDPDEIHDLYAQCHAGLVALDPRHNSHNIPGKFLSYMQSGLPVLANINAGNDLVKMIREQRVGQVCEVNEVHELVRRAEKLINQIDLDPGLADRCKDLFKREFSVENTVSQITAALTQGNM
ncbi:glycosyltransferase family 4 protein [Paracoccaceae bacterium]|nr:glycosyltransferase family 4 protein [Paracoccaceae bacterium]